MKRSLHVGLAVLAGFVLLAAACGDDDSGGGAKEGPAISIGAQDFGESSILAEIYKQAPRERRLYG